jgi:adenosine deaminase
MFERKASDLHMHLNGSFSLDFLREIAEKNNATSDFLKLKEVKEEYKKLIGQEALQGEHNKSIALIWTQFSLIHKIIQTLADILHGTINVIDASKACYMEIRTTPKDMDGASWEKYVDAFVNGLIEGNKKCSGKKIARGLLSLDRTIHTEKMSYQIIDRVVLEKQHSGLLVGIDISGNPMAERKLTGDTLASVLRYALDKDIGVAIHIGEANTDIEKNDVDIILAILTSWSKKSYSGSYSGNYFHGKIRLGHGIFLTEEQRVTIKKLRIPIEVCPSCHEKLNWWHKSKPHPVTHIYQFWKDPVVTGTDDEMIFGGNAKEENQRVLEMLGYPKNEKKEEARIHQSTFRFAPSR